MNNKGRKPKYLTVERFEQFLQNDWYHLQSQVASNKRMLWIILAALIGTGAIDRIFG